MCNLNQFRHSQLKNISEIRKILESYSDEKRNKSDGSSFENSIERQGNAFKKEFNDDDDEDQDIDYDDIELDEDYIVEELVAIAASDYTQDELQYVGHQFKKTILSCSWRGFDCMTG